MFNKLNCIEINSCLSTRRVALSLPPGDALYRDWPCQNCLIGRDRQMASFVPEPDIAPYRRPAESPKNGHLTGPPCPMCGKPRPDRSNIEEGKPCDSCRRQTPEWRETHRAHQREYWRKKQKGAA